jgi:hypothetical protein
MDFALELAWKARMVGLSRDLGIVCIMQRALQKRRLVRRRCELFRRSVAARCCQGGTSAKGR